MAVNRLATPLPDSVLDRYYAERPDEADFRQRKTASAVDPEAFEQVFAAKADPRDKEGPATGAGTCGAWYEYTSDRGFRSEAQCQRKDTVPCHYCQAPTCPKHAKRVAGHTTCYRNHN